MFKKITMAFLITLFSINLSFALPSGVVQAWDVANGVWRAITVDANGLIVGSSATAATLNTEYRWMAHPSGSTAGYYPTNDTWLPLQCDADGKLMISGGGGGGASTLLGLTDTPSAYTGQAGKAVIVNSGETAVEFSAVSTSIIEEHHFCAGSFDYPNGESQEIAPLDYQDGTNMRIYFHSFDDGTPEYICGTLVFKEGADSSTYAGISVEIQGYSNTATSGDLHMGIEYKVWDGSSSWDTTYTGVTSEITVPGTTKYMGTNEIYITPTFEAGEMLLFRIYRKANDIGDTLSGDWRVTNVVLKYER